MNRMYPTLVAGALLAGLTLPSIAAVSDHLRGLNSDDLDTQNEAQKALFSEAAQASRPGAEEERMAYNKDLCAALVDGQPRLTALILIRQLGHIGGAESVRTLNRLLTDENEQVREAARMALTGNPSAAAGKALAAALQSTTDERTRKGIIDSLGFRGNPDSIPTLVSALKDPTYAEAAASALARIVDPTAARALVQARRAHDAPYLTQALIDQAATARREGNKRIAARIYRLLMAEEEPEEVRAVAITGYLTLADASSKVAMEYLQHPSEVLRAAVVEAASQIDSPRLRRRVAQLIPEASPELQLRILAMLEQTSAPASEKWVLPLLESDREDLAQAAKATLAAVGTEQSIPALMKVSAIDAMSQLSSPQADAAIAKLAAEGDAESRAIAIRVLANREGSDRVRELVAFAKETDDAVAVAALQGLKDVAPAEAMPAIADLMVEASSSSRARGAMDAAVSVLRRSPNPEATVEVLAKTLPEADESAQAMIYKVLVQAGSDAALAPVVDGTGAASADLRAPALRALTGWQQSNAIDPLLALVENPDLELKEHALAVRGLARLLSSDARLDASKKALDAARRPEEKKLILGAIGQSNKKAALKLLEPYLTDPDVQSEAKAAAEAVRKRTTKK